MRSLLFAVALATGFAVAAPALAAESAAAPAPAVAPTPAPNAHLAELAGKPADLETRVPAPAGLALPTHAPRPRLGEAEVRAALRAILQRAWPGVPSLKVSEFVTSTGSPLPDSLVAPPPPASRVRADAGRTAPATPKRPALHTSLPRDPAAPAPSPLAKGRAPEVKP